MVQPASSERAGRGVLARSRGSAAARWAGFALVEAASRGLCLAATAAASSHVGGAEALRFVATWAPLFAAPALVVGLVELPLLAALGRGRARASALAAAAGLAWGALLGAAVPHVGALGVWALAATAVGGGGAALAWPPGRARSARRRGALALGLALALPAALAALVLWADPAGRYASRHEAGAAGAGACDVERPAGAIDDTRLAAAVARAWICRRPPESLPWSWQEAVAVEGLLAYGRCAGDPAPRDYARRWVEARRRQARDEPLWADAAAPLVVVAEVASPDEPDSLLDGLELGLRGGPRSTTVPRARSGALSHLGLLLGGRLPPQVWVDSLFMYGVTLDRLFERRGARWALDEAGRLGRSVLRDLQGPRGLLRHGRFELGGAGLALPVERTSWARGNAWALFFLADHQRLRRAAGLGPEPAFDRARAAMLGPLLDAQDAATGLWRTDLEGSGDDAPLETSASALFVAALAALAREGRAPGDGALDAAVDRGLRGVRSRVRWRGGRPEVLGASSSTVPGYRAYYRGVETRPDLGHGVGAVLLALTARCDPREAPPDQSSIRQ